MRDEPGVVIELGPVRPDVPAAAVPPRPWSRRQRRPVVLALVAALTLTATAAAPPAPPVFTEVATIRLGPVPGIEIVTIPASNVSRSSDVLLSTERVFVSTRAAGAADWLITAHDLRDGHRAWSVRYPAGSDAPDRTRPWLSGTHMRLQMVRPWPDGGQPHLRYTEGILLVNRTVTDGGRRRSQTDGLDARTGQLRWSVPHLIEVLGDGRFGIVTEEIFPAGSAIDIPEERPGALPMVYISQDGQAYREPPLAVRASLINLASGEPHWTSPRGVRVATVDGAGPLLLFWSEDGSVEARDARNGQLRHRFAEEVINSVSAADDGDLVLVRSGNRITAYSADNWQPRWTRSLPDSRTYPHGCGPLLCLSGTRTSVADPLTGRPLWSLGTGRHNRLDHRAGHLIEWGESLNPLRTVDPRTGRTLINLASWERITTTADDSMTLVSRMVGEETWLGLLEPGATRVRLLGPVPYRTARCELTAGHVACRTFDDVLRVWRYR